MSEFEQQDSKQEAVPFFARYLEGQIDYMEDLSEEEMQSVAGGKRSVNHKRSPGAKDIGGGAIATKKYPSDNEDSGSDSIVTQKFPSDNEDSGDGNVVTLKFPSDQEESAAP